MKLEIVRGRVKNASRPVSGPVFMIGSARDCDLVLADPKFPEVHSYLFVRPEGVTIRHLGEGPRIEVDGRPVHQTRLRDGDVLWFGPYAMQLHIDWPHGSRGDGEWDDAETRGARELETAEESEEGWFASQQLIRDLRAISRGIPALRLVAAEPEPPARERNDRGFIRRSA